MSPKPTSSVQSPWLSLPSAGMTGWFLDVSRQVDCWRREKRTFWEEILSVKKKKSRDLIYLISIFFKSRQKENVKPITAVSQKIKYTAGNRQFCKAVISHNSTI